MSRPLLILAAAASLAACNSDRTYECTIGQSSECNRDGQQGDCLAPGFCAFTDSSCGTGLRWDSTARDDLAGQCVDANGGGDGGALNLCNGTAALDGVPGQRCGVCDSGTYVCDGLNAVACQGELTLEQDVTSEGQVSATSVFSGTFPPAASVDGNLTTSWFSTGPEAGGLPTAYTWTNDRDRCITTIRMTANGTENSQGVGNPEDFGFGQVTFQISDASGTVVFSKVEPLSEMPDTDRMIDTGGVLGRSVNLLLLGHEQSNCGGFSELNVSAKL